MAPTHLPVLLPQYVVAVIMPDPLHSRSPEQAIDKLPESSSDVNQV